MNKGTPEERRLLHFLACRLRDARKYLNFARKETYNKLINETNGAYFEAWNSFQQAKRIVYFNKDI